MFDCPTARARLLALLVALGIVVVACGGNGDKATLDAPTPPNSSTNVSAMNCGSIGASEGCSTVSLSWPTVLPSRIIGLTMTSVSLAAADGR